MYGGCSGAPRSSQKTQKKKDQLFTAMNTLMLISLILFGGLAMLALVATFLPKWPSSVIGYGAMSAVWLSGASGLGVKDLVFWAIAVAIVIGIRVMLPRNISLSTKGVPFISGACITAAAVGMILNSAAGVIIGALVGAVLGAIAFSNTHAGRAMNFPSRQFFNYTAAKGLPVAVPVSMVASSRLPLVFSFNNPV